MKLVDGCSLNGGGEVIHLLRILTSIVSWGANCQTVVTMENNQIPVSFPKILVLCTYLQVLLEANR